MNAKKKGNLAVGSTVRLLSKDVYKIIDVKTDQNNTKKYKLESLDGFKKIGSFKATQIVSSIDKFIDKKSEQRDVQPRPAFSQNKKNVH